MNEKPSRLGRGLAALIGDMAPIEAPRPPKSMQRPAAPAGRVH